VLLFASLIWLGALDRIRTIEQREREARAQLEELADALEAYQLDTGDFPRTEEGLEALRRNPGAKEWSGPYIQQDIPLDPWGRAYRYARRENGAAEVITLGRDARGSKPIAVTKHPFFFCQ
jgi:general secretion pathway protein G